MPDREQTFCSSVSEIVAALDRLVESDVRTVHAGESLVVGAALGATTHFVIGAKEWGDLVLAIRKAETRESMERA